MNKKNIMLTSFVLGYYVSWLTNPWAGSNGPGTRKFLTGQLAV